MRGRIGPKAFRALSMIRLVLPAMSPNPLKGRPSRVPSGVRTQIPWSVSLLIGRLLPGLISGCRNRAPFERGFSTVRISTARSSWSRASGLGFRSVNEALAREWSSTTVVCLAFLLIRQPVSVRSSAGITTR